MTALLARCIRATMLAAVLSVAGIVSARALDVRPAEKGLQVLSPWPNVYTGAQENYALDDLKRIGTRWVRIAQGWDDIQHSGPTAPYNWTYLDRVVPKIVSRGLKPMFEITFNTPAWAKPPGTGLEVLPTDIPAFSRYVTALVQRYGTRIRAWEIFNEPIFHNKVEAYAPVLKAAYEAIKAVDPGAEVVLGGNPLDFGSGVRWLQALYTMGYGKYFTAVGVHPYDYINPPSNPNGNWKYMEGVTPSLRSVMAANGDAAKKIWITEIGYASCHPTNTAWTEQREATWLKDAYATFRLKAWAGPLFWYTYRDSGTTNETNENCYGIVRKDFSRKMAYYTFKRVRNR